MLTADRSQLAGDPQTTFDGALSPAALKAMTLKQRSPAPRTSTYSKLAEVSRPDIVLAGMYECCVDQMLTTPAAALVAPVTAFNVQVGSDVPLAEAERRIL